MKQWMKYIIVIVAFVTMAVYFLQYPKVEVNASDMGTLSENGISILLNEVSGENETGIWYVTIKYEVPEPTEEFADITLYPNPITGGYEDTIYYQLPEKVPTKDGYSFVEWTSDIDNDGSVESYQPSAEFLFSKADFENREIIFSAVWETVTVVYDYNDGDREDNSFIISNNNLDENGNFTLLLDEKPKRTNYKFKGWLWSEDNTLYNVGMEIKDLKWDEYAGEDIVFIAQWEELPMVTITYVGENESYETIQMQQADEEVTMFDLTVIDMVPKREYHKFVNWLCDIDNSIYESGSVKPQISWEVYGGKTITFTAQWSKLPIVNVEYIRYDNENVIDTIQQLEESEMEFSVNLPIDDSEYSGYKFMGWICKEDGTKYTVDGDVPTFSWENVTNGSTIQFTAWWEELPSVTIKYENEFGSTETESIKQDSINDLSFLIKIPTDIPVREYHKFAGWLCSVDKKVYEPGSVLEGLEWENYGNGIITFTAKWEWDDYTVFEEGKYSLIAGNIYYLPEGTWTVNDDGCIYNGGVTFSVSKDGDYVFKKE